jgi:hypothetical protein
MTVFISLDVETTGPAPGTGELCTIGAVAFDEHTLEDVGGEFYVRLLPASTRTGGWQWGSDTFEWWSGQEELVRAEALHWGEDRVPADLAMLRLEEWALGLGGKPTVAAHPACFDWAWVNCYSWAHIGRNKLGYRALCLRSMGYGMSQLDWGLDRTDEPDLYVASEVPHHALYDAMAQAEQLKRMLRARKERTA